MALKDLEKVFQKYEEIEIRGQKLKVYEYSLAQLPQVSKLFSRVSKDVNNSGSNLLGLLMQNLDVMYSVVALSLKEDVKDLQEYLTPEEFVEVAARVIEVNSRLFLEKILPRLETLGKEVENKAKIAQAGPG